MTSTPVSGTRNGTWRLSCQVRYTGGHGAQDMIARAQQAAQTLIPLRIRVGGSLLVNNGGLFAEPLEPLEQTRLDERLRNVEHFGNLRAGQILDIT